MSRPYFIGSILALGLFASGSATHAQEVVSPSVSQTVQPTVSVQPVLSQYISADGLTVEKLAGAALAGNKELQAARQNLIIAQGRLTQAGLRPNPTLDFERTTDALTGRQGEGNYAVGVSQLFETGGKRKKRLTVAQLELDRAQAEVRALERQIAAEVRNAYAQAVSAARQLATTQQILTLDLDMIRITEARLQQGDVAPLDLNLVRVEADRLRVQAMQAQYEIQAQFITLRTLIGSEPSAALKLAIVSERPPLLAISLEAATATALHERADLQAARIAEELGGARLQLAESQRSPNVAGSVRYSVSRSVFDNVPGIGKLQDKDHLLTAGVSIELPFRNRNQGEIAAAVGEEQQAKYRREFIEAVIKRDVALAYNRYNTAAATLAIFGNQIIPRAEQNLKTIRAAYNLGEMPILEVIAEQRRQVENQTQYNTALKDYYVALAELEKALGVPLPANAFSSTSVIALTENGELKPTAPKQ